MIYTYFLYTHFILNLIVGIYFLVTVRASNRQELVDYCAEVLVNTSMESSCTGLMNVSTYVFIAIVAALLLLELCESRCSLFSHLVTLFLPRRRSTDCNSIRVSPAHAEARQPVATPRLFPRVLHA